jgi:hypothetical protein
VDYFFADVLRAVEHEGVHGRIVACHFIKKIREGKNRALATAQIARVPLPEGRSSL